MLYLSLLHFLLSLLPTAFTDWIFLVAPRCWRKLFCPVTMLGSKGHGMRDGVVKDSHQWGGGCGPQSSSFAGRASLLMGFCITWGLLDFYSECFLWKGMDCILNTGHILPSFRKTQLLLFLWNTGLWERASLLPSACAPGCVTPEHKGGTNWAHFVQGGWADNCLWDWEEVNHLSACSQHPPSYLLLEKYTEGQSDLLFCQETRHDKTPGGFHMAQGPCWPRTRHSHASIHSPFSVSKYDPNSSATHWCWDFPAVSIGLTLLPRQVGSWMHGVYIGRWHLQQQKDIFLAEAEKTAQDCCSACFLGARTPPCSCAVLRSHQLW